jgi:deoxyribodipyrimidine photolyase-related protein
VSTRWLFGDQLGAHFTDDHDGDFLLVESRAVFRRRRFHRQKAHLVLSAMRHRAAELRERYGEARVRVLQVERYRDALTQVDGPLQVIHPTSRAAVGLVRSVGEEREVERLPARGFVTTRDDFASWAEGRGSGRLLLEDFYRRARVRHGVLLDGAGEPAGGRWNFDDANREPPPKDRSRLGVPEPWWPAEDEVDEGVRRDLDAWEREGTRFLGRDGPRRFAATPGEARRAFEDFLSHRLDAFGTYEDAVLAEDPWMAHSLVSAPLNLGLLDPLALVREAEEAWRGRDLRLASVEGFVRQVLGWRDYVWHLYWHFGEDYRRRNVLRARRKVPDWFADLDGQATRARCLGATLDGVADHGWVHHIPRLMILGSYALQRGWEPAQVTDWFHRAFVDGYDWVMVPNVVGMSQHADGGDLATKPYTSGGAYLDRMTDYCGGCPLDPRTRVGEDACPFTAGYWWFLARHRERFTRNHRMRRAVSGLDRLADLEQLVEQEERRGSRAP